MWMILYIYLFILLITVSTTTIYYYNINKNDDEGKRKIIIQTIQIFFLSFIPIVGQLFLCMVFKEIIEKWVDNDPTSLKNRNNPDFKLPEKVIEKEKIKSRFEILDFGKK